MKAFHKNWLELITPFTIVSILAFWGIIASIIHYFKTGDGWGLVVVVIYLPWMIALIVIDIVIKILLKRQLLQVWLIEIAIIIVYVMFYDIFIDFY